MNHEKDILFLVSCCTLIHWTLDIWMKETSFYVVWMIFGLCAWDCIPFSDSVYSLRGHLNPRLVNLHPDLNPFPGQNPFSHGLKYGHLNPFSDFPLSDHNPFSVCFHNPRLVKFRFCSSCLKPKVAWYLQVLLQIEDQQG